MSEPKRHHFLPESYLRRFTRGGAAESVFAVYDRKYDQFRCQTPRNTAVETHYYTVETETGEKSAHIEKGLAQIESLAMPSIDKLDAGELPTSHDRQTLALFVALLHTRVPQFERATRETANGFYKRTTRLALPTRESVAVRLHSLYPDQSVDPATVEQLFQIFQTGEYDMKFEKGWLRRTMLEMALSFGWGLWQMDWVAYHATPTTSFVTSDSPFVVLPPRNVKLPFPFTYGIGTRGAAKFIPLTQKVCLGIGDKGRGFRHELASQSEVRAINVEVARNCERNVIGRDINLVKSIVAKAHLSGGTERGPIVHVFGPGG
jgi:hypothetical protein